MAPLPLLPALVVLFFISGACGLIYQILWLRLLGLVFGVTVYSASTVWASFMAGLALGSVIGGRVGDRAQRPLVWFGGVEILVGLTALLTPVGLDALQAWYARAVPAPPESIVVVTFVRLAMSFAVLLVPTMMMGATLPLIVRSALFRGSQIGARAGLLYGTNTAGAIAGTLAAGLYLIPALGITRTFQLGAAMNVGVGLTAIAIGLLVAGRMTAARSRAGERDPATASGRPDAGPIGAPDGASASGPPGVAAAASGRDALTAGLRRLVLIVFFVSGFATLALEVVWFRAIVLIARPTVYTFAVMLACVLLGIALGSYLVTPFMRRRANWLAVLAGLEIAMGLAALLSLAMLGRSAEVNAAIAPYVATVLPAYLSQAIAASAPVILPAAILMGLAYPIGLRLYVGTRDEDADCAASRLGVFNSVNLTGAIVGSLVTGFLMLPAWGSRTSLIGIAGLIVLSGLALAVATTRRVAARLAWAGVVLAGFTAAAWQTADPFEVFLKLRYPTLPLAWHEEAVEGTVSVHGDGPGRYLLAVDGNHQANDTGSMLAAHRRISLLALAIHPEAREVLVVGLGGGATPGAISTHEGVEIDVVELSSAVVRASRFFAHANQNLLARPNVRLRVDDGRNYLALTRKKYDVITADIIQPIHAGSNNVYSREYFELVRRALKPGGMAMQWASGTDAEYKTIARTFQTVFPHTTVWADGSLLLGSLEPLVLRPSDFQWKLSAPARRAGIEELGIHSFEDLQALQMAGPDALREFVGPGPILTDDRPLAEYFLSLPRGPGPDLEKLRNAKPGVLFRGK